MNDLTEVYKQYVNNLTRQEKLEQEKAEKEISPQSPLTPF
jgi:hypothetical protein